MSAVQPAAHARSVTGIVLAGGRSSRFGADKLLARLDGRPLLHHPILALAACCDTLLVAVSRDGPEPALPNGVGVPIRIVRDVVADTGPLAGLIAGLEVAEEEIALVVGGDQPDLRPDLLRLLLAALGSASAVVLADEGQPRSLPVAVRRRPALDAARAALGTDRRSLLGVFLGLDAVVLPETGWRGADPDGRWRRDVDRPEDLGG
jgi:molybdopterin-guanine dinucleotide biosynthesis protein A